MFRVERAAVRLGCHHRDMAMSVIDAEGVSLNELVRRLVRDGLNREREARALGPSAPAAEPAGDDRPLRRSA